MIKEYKDTLNIGEYGEEILNYDTNEYIGDIINYIADCSVDIYNYDLWEWAKDNDEWIEEAISEGLYNIDSRDFDLMRLFMAGQYMQITCDLYENLDDIIAYAVLELIQDEFINKKRLVEVIEDSCYNVDNNKSVQYYIDIVKDTMEDYPMLNIYLSTGTAWTKSILVEGTKQDDLLQLIDSYYYDNGGLPVPMYTLDELLEGRIFISEDDDWEYINSLEMLPINGGQFYIDGIVYIEEVI